MKATVNKQEFLYVLGKVKNAIPKKSSLPILQNVLLQRAGVTLTILCNDLENELRSTIKAARDGEDGVICVPVLALEKFVKAMDDGYVTVEWRAFRKFKKKLIDYTATVSQGRNKLELPGMAAKDYPAMSLVLTENGYTVSNAKEALDRVAFAVAGDTSRPVLNAVNIKPTQGWHDRITLAAADGYQLAVHTVKVRGKPKDDILLPQPTICLLKKLFKNGDPIKICTDFTSKVTPGKVTIHVNGFVLNTRSLQGTFPNYNQLIPADKQIMTFRREAMLKALSVMASLEAFPNIVRLLSKGGKLNVSKHADAPDGKVTKVETVIDCRGKVKIAFSPGLLGPIIERCPEKVRISTETFSTCAKFKANGTTYVLMPMSVEW